MSNIKVSIHHPSGVKMHHTESIISFLAKRQNKASQFYLGHWLESILDEELEQLRILIKQFINGAQNIYIDDVVSIIINAMAAEKRNPKVNVSLHSLASQVESLYISASIESYRRRGWLELDSTLSIRPQKKVILRLTSLGILHAENINSMLH